MSRIRAAYYDPEGTRHGGLPTFTWRGAPPGYATRRQLRAAGLRPAQPIAAQILWRGVGGTRAAYLYRLDLAAPKRTATPAQLAAVAAALLARRTCATCGRERGYYIPRSLGECLACAESASWED